MPTSKAVLSIGLVACAQAALIIGLYRYGIAGSFALILLYIASLVACYVVLGRSARWVRGRPALHFVVALVLAGVVQSVAAVAALAVAFNIWGI